MGSISQEAKTSIDSIYGVFVDDRYMIPAMPTNFKNPTDPTTGNKDNPEPGTVWENNDGAPYKNGGIMYPEVDYNIKLVRSQTWIPLRNGLLKKIPTPYTYIQDRKYLTNQMFESESERIL